MIFGELLNALRGRKLHTMNIRWDAEKYTADFSYVHQFGHDVMGLTRLPTVAYAENKKPEHVFMLGLFE